MPRLKLGSLMSLPPALRPRIDPRGLRVGIVHLGIGAFHRAHQAVYTEEAIAAAGGDWGICGVTQRSEAVLAQVAPQDGLYTVVERDGGGEQLRVRGAVRELLAAPRSPELVLERIAAATTHVVTLTVTEKGYRYDPVTGRLRFDDPQIAAELADRRPRTAIGELTLGLDRRRRAGGAPMTVLCCDNLPANGRMLAGLVSEFAARLPDGAALQAWLQASVSFPATTVDRITPVATAADRLAVERALGVRDEAAVVSEPFRQWVIEDRFRGPRPAWELAGAMLTADVAPYEQLKLRLLNAGHSAIAYLGALAGYDEVAAAVAPDTPFLAFARALMTRDAAPTLTVPAGFDVNAYQDQLLERFANPALHHRTLQIAMDGSQKLPPRLLETIAQRRTAGAEPGFAALAVAAWMRFVSARRSDAGAPLALDDPLAAEIERALAAAGSERPAQVVDALLSLRSVFSAELAADRLLRELLVERLAMLAADGAQRAAASLLE